MHNHLNFRHPCAYLPAQPIRRVGPCETVICTLILVAFMTALQRGLFHLADSVEFSSFAMIRGTIMGLTVAAAFGWDWLERRRP